MQPVELLNLIAAKRVAGDSEWLKAKYVEFHDDASSVVHARIAQYLAQNTGFHSMGAFELGALPKQRCDVYAFLCSVLIRKDYDRLTVAANQQEIEHGELLAKLDEILKHPELAARIEINVHLK